MTDTNIRNEINHIQVRLFRLAWKEWGISEDRCADLFDMYNIDEYIADQYDLFHIQGDEANLDEISSFLRSRGEQI